MGKRIYNILFHTHTVSGIIICALLYVIFFAGSFAFFRDEIVAWEKNAPVKNEAVFKHINLNRMTSALAKDFDLYGRKIQFSQYYQVRNLGISLSASKDTTIQEGRQFFYMDYKTLDRYSYQDSYSIGEFLYRLHFFAQLNFFGRSGYALAGLITFFFLFAIITGVLVHWKKIVSNFYLFRPKAKLKALWTDAHTALGVIGLPFQFVFAVTGCYFIFAAIALGPSVAAVVYNGNTQKMYADINQEVQDMPLTHKKLTATVDLNTFVDRTHARWDNFHIKHVKLLNYGDKNMRVAVLGHPEYSKALTGKGKLIFKGSTGEILKVKDPLDNNYIDASSGILARLHFGDFGGLGLKIVYFILGLISCFVIISGILIWLVARDKKSVDKKKRKFNKWLGHIYLSTCLSMYPATAFTFVAVKLFVHQTDASRMTSIYQIFFYAWLVLIALFTLKRDNYFTNKASLILGSIIGFLVPVANGYVTGNWPWVTYSKGFYDIFFIDVFWLVLTLTTLLVAFNLKRLPKKKKRKKKSVKKQKKKQAQPLASKAI